MRPLYEIDQAILDCVDIETGEILDSAKLDALQMERTAKLEGVALWVKDMRAEAEAVKAEADKLNARRKALEGRIESVKAWLLEALGGDRIKTARCNVYKMKIKKAVIDDEQSLVDMFLTSDAMKEKYLRIREPEIDKTALKDSLKNGIQFEFAHLEESESIVIR